MQSLSGMILLSMIFLHIIDDFVLQAAILNKLKQRDWWKQNYPNPNYKNDYVWALAMHAFSWTFMVMFPIAIVNHFQVNPTFLAMFVWNMVVHGAIDHLKANELALNLIEDQSLHMTQIVLTWISWLMGNI